MFQNKEGQPVPDVQIPTRANGKWTELSTADFFRGKNVVVFSLPGAFTPTCSSAHVPRFNELAPVFKAHGVDEIVCVSVNDGFVMEAWQAQQAADRITFLADGNGDFTREMGMLVDKRNLGFGPRSWRYSMLVEDGVIEKMFIEPEVEGDPYEVSDADTMLKHVAPDARLQPDIVLFTKPGCAHCARAKAMLDTRGLEYVELPATPRVLRAVSHERTTPRVFIDGQEVGGANELEAHLGRA